MPDGRKYMIYKLCLAFRKPLQLGIAVADSPNGEFTRLSESLILDLRKGICMLKSCNGR